MAGAGRTLCEWTTIEVLVDVPLQLPDPFISRVRVVVLLAAKTTKSSVASVDVLRPLMYRDGVGVAVFGAVCFV